MDRPIGVFDSGIGGLNVLHECAALLKNESFIYLADYAAMPFGEKGEDEVRRIAVNNAERLVEMNCKAIVVACNTATAIGLEDIRRLYPSVISLGLEPAIKPCAVELDGGYAVALVTPATAKSKRFNELMNLYGDNIVAVRCSGLAKSIEENIFNLENIRADVYDILSDYRGASAVVLGCSHYSYISNMIKDYYGGRVNIYDGARALALNLKRRLDWENLISAADERTIRFYSTKKIRS